MMLPYLISTDDRSHAHQTGLLGMLHDFPTLGKPALIVEMMHSAFLQHILMNSNGRFASAHKHCGLDYPQAKIQHQLPFAMDLRYAPESCLVFSNHYYIHTGDHIYLMNPIFQNYPMSKRPRAM